MTPPDSEDSGKSHSRRIVLSGPETLPAKPAPTSVPREIIDTSTQTGYGNVGAAAPAPFTADDDQLSIAKLLVIVRRRWAVALPLFLAALSVAWWRYTSTTPTYEASTSIRLETQQQRIPGITAAEELGAGAMSLATEIQIIQSRAGSREVAQRVAYAVQVVEPRVPRSALFDSVSMAVGATPGSYRIEAPVGNRVLIGTSPDGARDTARMGEWLELDGVRLRPAPRAFTYEAITLDVTSDLVAAERLRAGLRVSQPVRDASVLRLTFRGPDPRLAAQITDAAAEVFAEGQARRRQTGGRTTVSFIRTQLDSLERQLLSAELDIRDWRARQREIIPGAAAEATVSRRTEYEARMAEKRYELETVEDLLRGSGARSANDTTPQGRNAVRRVLSSPAFKGGSVGSNILATITDLEAKRADLLARRTNEDPDVQLLNRTIGDYELQGQLFMGTYIEGLRTEIAGYERSLAKVGASLATFPGQELELATLQRNAEVLASLQTVMRTRLKEAEIANAADEPTVELLDRALPPGTPVAPVMTRYLAAGLAVGGVLALLGALVRDRADRSIHSREDIERSTGAPLMGLIPNFHTARNRIARYGRGSKRWRVRGSRARTSALGAGSGSGFGGSDSTDMVVHSFAPIEPTAAGKNLISISAPRHVSSEAYRMLRTNLRFAPADQSRQVMAISSPSPGDGKSTTSLNYAATLAVLGKKVLIVDGDMRRGTMHRVLGLHRTPGLSAVLAGRIKAEEAVRSVVLTEGVSLDFLACGETPPNPTELLGGKAVGELVAWARGRYDFVVLDTPPVNMFADGLLLAAAGDAMLLIGRAGKSRRDELQVAAEQIRGLGVPLAGVVLNDFDVKRDGRYGSYYYYDRYQYKYYSAYGMMDEEPSGSSTV